MECSTNKKKQLLFVSRRTKVSTSLLLQWFLQHPLQHHRSCVKVEGHVCNNIVIGWEGPQFALYQYSFAGPSVANQHHRSPLLQQKIHKVSNTSGFRCRYHASLRWFRNYSFFHTISFYIDKLQQWKTDYKSSVSVLRNLLIEGDQDPVRNQVPNLTMEQTSSIQDQYSNRIWCPG